MNVKIGIIGTGLIGTDHALRINNSLKGGIVAAVSDIDKNSAQMLADKLGTAKVFDNPLELIQDKEVAAILVCSSGPTHEEFVLAAIKANKPVFCEKPLATTSNACKKIVAAEMELGKRLVQVGYMRRYDSGYKKLKNVIDKGEIGEVLIMHCVHRNPSVPESYLTEMAVTDSLVHELDILRWLLGEDYKSAQMLFAKKTKYSHGKLMDPQILLLETVSGVRIDVEMFVNCQYGYEIQCSAVGSEGVADLPEPESLLFRRKGQSFTNILPDWKERFIEAYDEELQEFIDGVHSGVFKGPSAWDGYAAAVASDVCAKAQRSGAIENIIMPETPAFYR